MLPPPFLPLFYALLLLVESTVPEIVGVGTWVYGTDRPRGKESLLHESSYDCSSYHPKPTVQPTVLVRTGYWKETFSEHFSIFLAPGLAFVIGRRCQPPQKDILMQADIAQGVWFLLEQNSTTLIILFAV